VPGDKSRFGSTLAKIGVDQQTFAKVFFFNRKGAWMKTDVPANVLIFQDHFMTTSFMLLFRKLYSVIGLHVVYLYKLFGEFPPEFC
jgi:hypothetical protein